MDSFTSQSSTSPLIELPSITEDVLRNEFWNRRCSEEPDIIECRMYED